MNKKIILIIIVITIGAGFGIYQGFIKEEKPTLALEKVFKGQIFQEVSETGTVKAAEEISLSFQRPGRIEKIYVKVGEEVRVNQKLAKLETGQLEIQLAEAQASLELAQAKLNQLLAGTSEEEIKLAETAVSNAEVALNNAKQNLEDIKADAASDLDQAYEDALTTLDNAYLKLSNAFNTVSTIQRTYFSGTDQEGLQVKTEKDKIKNALNSIKPYIEAAKIGSQEDIDIALREMKGALDITAGALKVIRDATETPVYRNLVSSSDKTSLDTQRANINTALTNIVNSQQTIASTKLTNEININIAQAKVDSAQGDLQSKKDTLAIKRAGARQVDIDLYNAQIRQAQAKVDLLKKQIEESILKSPIEGVVTQINKKVGETAQITDFVISVISSDDFQIEVDIYEEDIVKVKIGNPVDIALVALPDKIFKGKVVSIDPAEKLIEGVVYYEVIIGFIEELPKEVKPSMTADVAIKTAFKENVLIIPNDAIQEKNGKFIVEVFKNGLIQERVIEIGLKGSDDMVEVVSGLQEGEEIIIR